MAFCKEKESSKFKDMADGEEKDPLKEIHTPVKKEGWFGTVYNNPPSWTEWFKPGAVPFLKMKCLKRNQAGIPNEEELNTELPVHKIDENGKEKLEKPPNNAIQFMWIGHATFLVQFDGLTVLADPVFLYRCSPVQLVGPYRYRPTPCEIDDLPKIDAVIVSHNHYDHLEHDAVQKLNNRFKDIKWYVPEGTKTWFQKYDCTNVKEMTWWEEDKLSDKQDVKFCCVPAQHWSQRTPVDAMKSLWCGWVIKSIKHTFYYSGDTGYCPVFKAIGEKYGPMDLSAIPIGCYAPRDFMKPQHIGPKEAVIVHEEVRSKRSIGIHWGTFNGLGSLESSEKPLFQYNKYATKKTLAKGLLDISLLMANASQLKAMLNAGTNVDYFWVVIVLIAISLILQLTVGGMLLVLGSMETKSPEVKRHVNGLNNAAVGLICVITVVNIFIAAFGIKISD